MAVLTTGSAFGASTPAETRIKNQSNASFEFEGERYQVNSNLVVTRVAPVYGLQITPDGTEADPGHVGRTQAGGPVTYPYELTNTGNTTDSYTLGLPFLSGASEPHLRYIYHDVNGNGHLDPGENDSITHTPELAPGETIALLVRFTVPGTATPGDEFFLDLTGTSSGDPTLLDEDNVNRTVITDDAVLELEKNANVSTVFPGGVIDYTLRALNTGNEPTFDPGCELTIDGTTRRGIFIHDPIPEETGYEAGSLSGVPAGVRRVFSTDGGTTWTEAGHAGVEPPAADVTDVGVFVDGTVAVGQQIGLEFSVRVSAAASGDPLINTGEIQYRTRAGCVTEEATNRVTVQLVTRQGAKVFIGPKDQPETTHRFRTTKQHPAKTVSFDDLGDTGSNDTDETVDGGVPRVAPNPFGTVISGSFVVFRNTLRNGATFTDTLNVVRDASRSNIPPGWTLQFFRADGITSLSDSNGDGLPDTGPLEPGEDFTILTLVNIPVDATEGDNGGAGFQTVVEARSSAYPSVTNRTINTIDRIMQLGDFWDPFEKSEDAPDVVSQGTVIPYTNTFGNEGPGQVYNTIIWDELPKFLENPHDITGRVTEAVWKQILSAKQAEKFDKVKNLMETHGTDINDLNGVNAPVKAISRVNPINGDVEWYMFEIPTGFRGQIHFNAEVAVDTPDGYEIINTFHLTSDTTSLASTNKVQNVVGVSAVIDIVKEVNRESASAGEPLLYTVEVANGSDNGETLKDVIVDDRLPRGFRYIESTARVDEVEAAPTISRDGRTLSWSLGDLLADESRTITYAVQVTTDTPVGDSRNTARVSAIFPQGTRGWTEDTATVEIEEGVFTNKSVIIGKVYIDRNDNRIHDVAEPTVEGARIYLEDGTVTLTDADGKYHFSGVRPGLHTVRLDESSLPEGLAPRSLRVNNLGRPTSELIELKWGTPRKVNFRVREPARNSSETASEAPPPAGRLLESSLTRDDTVTFIELVTDRTVEFSVDSKATPGTALIDLPGITETEVPLVQRFDDSNVRRMRLYRDEDGNRLRISVLLRKRTSGYQPVRVERAGPQRIRIRVGHGGGKPPDYDPQRVGREIPFDDLDPQKSRILSPADGARFVTQEKISVSVACHLAASFELQINGEPVPENTIGRKSFDTKKRLAVYRYISVPLKPGENTLRFASTPPGKKEARVAVVTVYRADAAERLEVESEPKTLLADGLTEPVLILALLDENDVPSGNGTVVTVELDKGQILSPDFRPTERGHQARIENGHAMVRLSAASSPEKRTVTVTSRDTVYEHELVFQPHLRDWILTGYADARVTDLDRKRADQPDRGGDDGYDGEVGLFMKGKLPRDFLLTASYNSDHDDEDGDIMQSEDPEKYYPVYGDESEQEYEAESRDNLFLKVEKDQSYAMYGDFETDLEAARLAAYNRSFTGGKLHLETDYFDADGFVSYNDQTQVRTERRGDGTSGYYQFDANILENSETITLETRDRDHPDEVLEERTLSRYSDYRIDYERGRVLFKRPVHSQNADHNPIYVVAEYEVDNEKDRNYHTYGGRVATHDKERRYELGLSHIIEEGAPIDHTISGVDASFQLAPDMVLRGEYAETESYVYGADNGYAVELVSERENRVFEAYTRDVGADFDNTSLSEYSEGVQETGVRSTLKLTETLSIEDEVYTRTESDPERERIVAKHDFIWSAEDWEFRLGGGYIDEEEKNEDGDIERRESPFLRIGGARDLSERLGVEVLHQHALRDSGTEEPTETEVDLTYQLTERTKLFVGAERREKEDDDAEINLVLGAESDINDTFSAFEKFNVESGNSGRRTYSSTGLDMDWAVNEELNLTGSAELSSTIGNDENDEDFWSLTSGFDYHPLEHDYTLAGRYEVRVEDDSEDHLLELGGTTKFNERTTFFARDTMTYLRQNENDDEWTLELLMGLAYRPVFSDRWNFITDLEVDFESGTEEAASEEIYDITYALEAHYEHDDQTRLEMKYACKYAEADFADSAFFTDVKAVRLERDFMDRFYASAGARWMNDYDVDTYTLGYGVEAGARLKKDFRIAFGYNFDGFHDDDLSHGSYWEKGPYVALTWKFDESLFGTLNRLRGTKK